MPTIKVQPAHQGLIIPFPKDFSEEFSEDLQASVEFKFNSAEAECLTNITWRNKKICSFFLQRQWKAKQSLKVCLRIGALWWALLHQWLQPDPVFKKKKNPVFSCSRLFYSATLRLPKEPPARLLVDNNCCCVVNATIIELAHVPFCWFRTKANKLNWIIGPNNFFGFNLIFKC